MRRYDLYASSGDDLGSAREDISSALGVVLKEHESGWRGGIYYRGAGIDDELFILQRNLFADGEGPAEDDFPHVEVLLYIEKTGRSDYINNKLTMSGYTLLRSEVE